MGKISEKIHIKPEVLRTLRENSGYSVKELAKKIDVSEDKIIRVENGNDDFTLKQIRKLSEIYKVPLAAFFSDDIPHIPSLPDYRLHRDRKISPRVYLAIRRAKYLADMVHEISGKISKIPYFEDGLTPKELAERLREFLSPDPPSGFPNKILDYYKRLIEEKLSMIVIEYPLKTEDVGGFTVRGDLSVIVLNESDKPTVKLFSLFHEVSHILRGETGICSITMEEDMTVEMYCNRFAAEFLMPEGKVKEFVNKYGTSTEALKKMQRTFGVSIHALMIRLLNLGYISQNRYNEFREKYEKPPEKRVGGKNWESTYIHRAGYFAIREVKRAYKEGKITLHKSMEILDMKLKYIEKVIA